MNAPTRTRLVRSAAAFRVEACFIAALAFYPLTYALLTTLAGLRWGALAAVATLLLVPFTGYVALRTLEELDDVVGDLRAVVHSLFRRYGHRRLIVQRDAIRDEMLAVAREMSEQRA